MTRPLGYIVVGEHGWPHTDSSHRVLLYADEHIATSMAELTLGGKVVPVVRWNPSGKRPHERGTT